MTDKVSNEEALVTNLKNLIRQLAHALEEQYSWPFLSDIKDKDKRECSFAPLNFKRKFKT